MQPEPTPQPPPLDAGLPPVQPPSGGMILRLFLTPFLIVAVLVGLYLGGRLLHGWMTGAHAPDHYLRRLDSPNPEIRWRAASDLSQELPRSPRLEADATFAVALAGRLRTALDEGAEPERAFAARYDGLTPAEREAVVRRELAPRRNLTMYLAACLGSFVVPVGAPLLAEMATQTDGMEPVALAERRGRALFGLAVLGQRLQRYNTLPEDDRERIDAELQAAGESQLTAPASEHLRRRREGRADSLGVAAVIRRCAADDNPYLRELAAYVSNFWPGSAVEAREVEDTLVGLTTDRGVGEEALRQREELNPAAGAVRPRCLRPGFKVQANANLALCRRGSPRVRLDLLDDMLSPERLHRIFVLRQADGRETPDEALTALTVSGTLRALVRLHQQRPEFAFERFRPAIDARARDDDPAIRAAAQALIEALDGK